MLGKYECFYGRTGNNFIFWFSGRVFQPQMG